MPEPSSRVRHAEASLRAAEILLREGLYRDAVSRAYYAMFYAAKALLATKGLHPRTHGGVLQALGEHFAKPGTLDPELTGSLGFAMQSRQRADYGEDFVVTAEDAMALVARARAFVSRLAGLVGKI